MSSHLLGELQDEELVREMNDWPELQQLAHMVPVTNYPTLFINHTETIWDSKGGRQKCYKGGGRKIPWKVTGLYRDQKIGFRSES